jgi:hypothetical protein
VRFDRRRALGVSVEVAVAPGECPRAARSARRSSGRRSGRRAVAIFPPRPTPPPLGPGSGPSTVTRSCWPGFRTAGPRFARPSRAPGPSNGAAQN